MTAPIEPDGKPLRLELPSGGWLCGDVCFASDPSAPAILFIHGFGSQRRGEKAQALRSACARHGWTFAAFDFRGHGESSGTLPELRGSDLLDDLDAMAAHLVERGTHRLGLVGSSMGGWAASWFALRRPELVAGCVLLAPAFFFLTSRWCRLTDEQRRGWKQSGRLRVRNDWVDTEIGYRLVEEMDRYPVAHLAAAWSKPLLIFHGVQDDIVPYTHSVCFLEQAAGPLIELRLLKTGDHRLTAFKDEIADTACDFLARAWAAGPGRS